MDYDHEASSSLVVYNARGKNSSTKAKSLPQAILTDSNAYKGEAAAAGKDVIKQCIYVENGSW
jgi:hypothetical protein